MRSHEYLEHLAKELGTEDIVVLLNIVLKNQDHKGTGGHPITVTTSEPGEVACRHAQVTGVHLGGDYNINLQADYLPEMEEA